MGLTVKQLRETLEKLPDELEVVYPMHSDYRHLELDCLVVMKGVDQAGDWVMRSHSSMSDDNKSREKTFLAIGGY